MVQGEPRNQWRLSLCLVLAAVIFAVDSLVLPSDLRGISFAAYLGVVIVSLGLSRDRLVQFVAVGCSLLVIAQRVLGGLPSYESAEGRREIVSTAAALAAIWALALVGIGRRRTASRPLQANDEFDQRIGWHTSELAETNTLSQGESSEHKPTKREVSEAEAQYQSLIESLPLNVFHKDLQGQVTAANRRYCETLGRPLEDLLGKTDFDLFPKEMAEKYRRDDLGVLSSGKALETVEKHRTPDGQLLYVQVLKAPARNTSGETVGIQCMFWDVTEREQAGETLRQSQQQLSLAMEASGIGCWTWDVGDGTMAWDHRMHSIFGMREGMFEGSYETFLSRIHTDDVEAFRRAVSKTLDQGRDFEVDYRILWPDGTVRYLSSRASVSKNGTDRVAQVTGVCLDLSQRKKSEEALRQANRFLDSIVDNIPTMLFVKDTAELRYVRFNKAGEDLVGFTYEEVLGKNDFELYSREEAEFSVGRDLDALESKKLVEVQEEEVQTRYKGKRILHTKKIPILDEHGKARFLLGISEDITEQKRSEAALLYERYLLHSLMDSMPDSIYYKDCDGRFIRINRALAEQFGLSNPAEAIGKTDFDFFAEEHAAEALRDEQQILQSGKAILNKEEREIGRDGKQRWVSTTKMPLRDQLGRVTGTFGVSHDITRRRENEIARRENAERTRMIVDTASDAFIAMDAEGVIIDWNPRAEAIFGWKRDEAVGRLVAETIVPPQYRKAHAHGLDLFLKTGEGPVLNRRIEISAMRRNGKPFAVELTITPMELGGTFVFNAFLHDITERKRSEAELKAAKESAESANLAKSAFLANMSHEIRTPMNAIIGMTELVLDTPLEATQREYLSVVQDSGDALLAVIDDVLDFSKIEAGHLDLECEPFDLHESLGDMLKSLAIRADAKSLELACRIDKHVPVFVAGDRLRLRQIIVNLVGNAIKFTEKGEVIVDVEVDWQSQSEVALHFRVSDTGIGILEDKRATIFAPFEQADNTTTRRFGGTGLGLAISSKLVGMMHGRIWVDSEFGAGSTFHFTARFQPAAQIESTAPKQTVALEGLPLLVVDDNATNRKILFEILTNWSMKPTCVEGAAEAIDAMHTAKEQDRPYALVLTDANMPETDGFGLAEMIHGDSSLSSTIVMMLTSSDRSLGVARCDELGVAACLTKPIKQSELFDAIVLALNITRPEEEVKRQAATTEQTVLRPLRVLLAEDSLVNQKLAVGLMKKHGHSIVVANNGAEAIANIEQQVFDVVLMDVQMPEVDGLEATRIIRSREKKTGGHIPIVAITAHAMIGDRERCLESGMDGYISKPIRANDLFAAILEAVGPDAAGETGQEPAAVAPQPPADDLIDWTLALEAVQGDHGLLRELVEAYLQESPQLMKKIGEAIGSGNAKSLQLAAHTLKGSMRYFGANAAFDSAYQLESMGRDGQFEDASLRLDELKQEIEKIRPRLAAFINQ